MRLLKISGLLLTLLCTVWLLNGTNSYAQHINHTFSKQFYQPTITQSGASPNPDSNLDDDIVGKLAVSNFISLANFSGELNNSQDRSVIDNSGEYGWSGVGLCQYINDRTEAGNGMWRIALSSGCEIYQMTDHKISRGQAFSLLFDASTFAAFPDTVVAELYVEHENEIEEVITTQEFKFSFLQQNNWVPFQLLIEYGALDAYIDHTIGIKFRNPGTASPIKWLAVDNIRLVFFEIPSPSSSEVTFVDSWQGRCNQIWTGENFWANRLQDWQVRNGRLETRRTDDEESSQYPLRTIHRLSSQINETPQELHLQVSTGLVDAFLAGSDSFSGFLIGAGVNLDYRAAALIHGQYGKNGGIIAAVDHLGRAMIRNNETANELLAIGTRPTNGPPDAFTLELTAQLYEDGQYILQLQVLDKEGILQSQAQAIVPSVRVLGNVALVANEGDGNTRHWFDQFSGGGGKLTIVPQQAWGPILFTTYTLSDAVLTLSAQLAPVCSEQYGNLRLEIKQGEEWVQIAQSDVDPQSYTAQLRVNDWNDSTVTEYRVLLDETPGEITHEFAGTIQADPQDREELTVGVFTCQVMLASEPIRGTNDSPYNWTRQSLVFPHEHLVKNATYHNSDILVFPGDQLYEFQPTDTDRSNLENQILDYLYKWYLFGWIWRDQLRNRPSIIIPDDHDVYQGNVWGEGGRLAQASGDGGYTEPAEFVNVVQRTQTGNLPPPFDPTPVEQGIDVYYTNVTYGRVGFAVLEDRKFKTGPQSEATELELLGQRQHEFLNHWVQDWENQELKIAVSQTPFAQSYTHQTVEFNRVEKNFDSNGWPKTERDKAVGWLRRAFAPHINGDQHLAITFQHGIEQPRDAVYSFTGPSMMNSFPRVWDPTNPDKGSVNRHNSYLGPYTDDFGNYLDVLGVANPAYYYRDYRTHQDPVAIHDLGIGYGIVRINKPERTYTFEAWPIYVDPSAPNAAPYDGWPITVVQADNDGRVPVGYLREIKAEVENPVIRIVDEITGETLYALRIQGSNFAPPIYDLKKTYTVEISEPETGYFKEFTQAIAISNGLPAIQIQPFPPPEVLVCDNSRSCCLLN